MAADYPDYRHRTGILVGLNKLNDFIDDVLKETER